MFIDPDELVAAFLREMAEQRGWTFRPAAGAGGGARPPLAVRWPGGETDMPADALAWHVRAWLAALGGSDTDDVVAGVVESVTDIVARA